MCPEPVHVCPGRVTYLLRRLLQVSLGAATDGHPGPFLGQHLGAGPAQPLPRFVRPVGADNPLPGSSWCGLLAPRPRPAARDAQRGLGIAESEHRAAARHADLQSQGTGRAWHDLGRPRGDGARRALLHAGRRRIDAPAARHGLDRGRRTADAHRHVRLCRAHAAAVADGHPASPDRTG